MNTVPFVHEGLGNSSYVVELGNHSALVVDPDRTVQRYLDFLIERNLSLAGIFETHLHADFVSGAKELAAQSGAPVFLPDAANVKFSHQAIRGGQTVTLAGCIVTALDSPGHTPEHLSYVFESASGGPALFSGGSLIVGGAARTDLISSSMTESLTRAQFRTLHQAFASLPDATQLYPTHGGGSFCSVGAGRDRVSTLGRERQENSLLSIEDESEFARWFPTTFPAAPDYFFRLRPINQAGPKLRREIAGPPALTADQFAELRSECVVVDARSKEAYSRGHIPGSLSNPYRDVFAVWLGWLLEPGSRLLFLTDETPVEKLVDEALLVGHENLAGWLPGGIEAWALSGRTLNEVELVDAEGARKYLLAGASSLDVREPDEYGAGHLADAVHIPLGKLAGALERVPREGPVVVYCGHGERASTAVSLLEAAGFRDLVNLDGGIGSWQSRGFPVVL